MTSLFNPQTALFAVENIPLPEINFGLDAKAMLCWVSISSWDGHAYDRKVSEEIADLHGADKDAGRYRKRLLPKSAFQEIKQIVGLARRRHAFYTLPWDDDNYRVLPSANYLDHRKEMKALRSKFEAAYARLESRYQDLVLYSSGLGTMFKVEDYPGMRVVGSDTLFKHPEELRALFSFGEPKIKGMPTDDFRASIGDEEKQRVRDQIVNDVKAALRAGTKDLWHRLFKPVAHMSKCMAEFNSADADNKPKLYDSMVSNIVNVLDVLPKLNIEDDQSLEMMAQEIRRELVVDRKDIRNSPDLSNHLAAKTAEITRRMAAFMGLPAESQSVS